jgi:phosphonate transport system ATP-binding protein
MLALHDVTKRFGTNAAVAGVSLQIPRGQFVGVIGPSGAGKSTLLRLINRLAEPTDGRIAYGDLPVSTLRGRALRAWRARCAMIFQQFNLVGRMDVLSNVLMGRLNYAHLAPSLLKWFADADRVRAIAALERLGLGDFLAQRAETLSGGQQQRVAIARALVQEPDLILADEPIASLDPRNTRTVMDALKRINKDYGITVVCNLHALDLAREYCDRLVGMNSGRVVFDGTPAALTHATARAVYGIEAAEVLGEDAPRPADLPSRPIVVPRRRKRQAATGAVESAIA